MTNSFEFIPANNLSLRTPRLSLTIFLLSAILFLGGLFFLREYSARLEQECKVAGERVESETMNFIQRATQLLPDASTVNTVADMTQQHNLTMGGKASVWTKLFNSIDGALPEDSVILALENPLTRKPVFAAENRQFKIRIALSSIASANDVYAKLAALQEIESLSFTPRGEVKAMGRQCLDVDLEFTFNEAYAATP